MTINDRLRAVFVHALELDDSIDHVDVENLKYRDIAAWDSVGHMTLIAAIEDEFDVEFDTDQVIDMSRYQNREPVISRDMLDAACSSYFLEESESQSNEPGV